jgi:tRNA C32,U32 (ribose-2'-O)-methylase TrmJ
VFGREESGLSEAEVRLCAHACALPTGRIQPSMNLSHAVGVVTAELFARRTALTGDKDLGLELLGEGPSGLCVCMRGGGGTARAV